MKTKEILMVMIGLLSLIIFYKIINGRLVEGATPGDKDIFIPPDDVTWCNPQSKPPQTCPGGKVCPDCTTDNCPCDYNVNCDLPTCIGDCKKKMVNNFDKETIDEDCKDHCIETCRDPKIIMSCKDKLNTVCGGQNKGTPECHQCLVSNEPELKKHCSIEEILAKCKLPKGTCDFMRDGGGGSGCGQYNYPTFFDLSGKLEKQAEAGCNNAFQITTGNHHLNDTFQECEWVKGSCKAKNENCTWTGRPSPTP